MNKLYETSELRNLISFMHEKGVSYGDMSNSSGMSISALSAFLNNNTEPLWKTKVKLVTMIENDFPMFLE